MTRPNRIVATFLLTAVAAAFSMRPLAAAEVPAQLPDPDAKSPDTTKPVKVYILAGQSNMVGMGEISGGNTRHSLFFPAAEGDTSGVVVSVYGGAYSPTANYDKLTAKATKTIRYGGLGEDPLPKIDGESTTVVRGFIAVKTSGAYAFSPGYQDSTHNVMELEGREVYRKEPGKDAVQVPTKLTTGKRYAFKVTFLTRSASGLFWLERTDIPGTLETLVKQEGKFPHLIDRQGKWTVRNDVCFYEARISFQGGPLTVPLHPRKTTIGPELQFGHIMGHYHGEQVLLIKTAMGNRALAWDFRPPSSGKLPDVKEELKKWEGLEYRLMIEGVRKALGDIAKIVPGYKGQGYEIAGFAWFQGHKDGGSKDWIAEYEKNLVNLIQDVRAEFKVPKLPVLVATVGFEGKNMPENYLQIRQAQLAVGDPAKHPELAGTVLSVDTRDFWRSVEQSPRNQGYHYHRNAETYMLIGDAMGRAMVKLQEQKSRK